MDIFRTYLIGYSWAFWCETFSTFRAFRCEIFSTLRFGATLIFCMKPSREELQGRVKLLAKKKRSSKHKVPTAPESSHAAQGKVPKLGASSLPSSIREQGSPGQFWARGRPPHPVAYVSKEIGPQLCSPLAAVATSPPRRTA